MFTFSVKPVEWYMFSVKLDVTCEHCATEFRFTVRGDEPFDDWVKDKWVEVLDENNDGIGIKFFTDTISIQIFGSDADAEFRVPNTPERTQSLLDGINKIREACKSAP